MDFNAVNAAAEGYREDMVKFLRDLVKIPGESAEEGNKIARAKAEMEKLGFDKIDIDPQGNLLGYMGSGEKLIAFDGHMDTVNLILTMAMKQKMRSVVAVRLTKRAGLFRLFMALKS